MLTTNIGKTMPKTGKLIINDVSHIERGGYLTLVTIRGHYKRT
jgi:hypothetical protein